MRKLVVFAAAVAVVFALALPVSAADTSQPPSPNPNCDTTFQPDGTMTCTLHAKDWPFAIGPVPCPTFPPGDLVLSANGIMHMTINNARDFWITGTLTGPAVITSATGKQLFVGHGETWFGVENNNRNGVDHFTENVTGTNLVTGQSVSAHFEGHVFFVPVDWPPTGPPQIVPSPGDHFNISCS